MASAMGDSNSDREAAASANPIPTITSSSEGPAPSRLYSAVRLDSRWDDELISFKYTDTSNPEIPAEQSQPIGSEAPSNMDSWKEYCFVVVRELPSTPSVRPIRFKIFLMSSYIVQACYMVMSDVRGVSWTSQPTELDPNMLIAYFSRLGKHEEKLSACKNPTEKDGHVLESLRSLLSYMRRHYRRTLERFNSLVENHEITFDLLYMILLPGTIIIDRCPITRETRALRLLAATLHESNDQDGKESYWDLECEYLEFTTGTSGQSQGGEAEQSLQFGMVDTEAKIHHFSGVEKIITLPVYPIHFHPNPMALKAALLERAYMWASLCGVHHVYYKGDATRPETHRLRSRQQSVSSRIIVDKTTFLRLEPDCELPTPQRIIPLPALVNVNNGAHGLTDPDLLLAPPIVYGFSLKDQLWLQFNVNHISQITWDDEAFDSLVLPPERKAFLHGLIEAHSRFNMNVEGPMAFDDFVRGKGRGLVINLFGPPGVGKTLSAEATSEHLRRPLYILGNAELGTSANDVDKALRKAFDLAAAWRAVLLIDEADVFLEQRSPDDVERNAMVAIFLRHLEYYQGILFLTTNRTQTFDEAFLSRMHVALRFDGLSMQAKAEIWRAFLRKAGLEDEVLEEEGFLSRLVAHDLNGRQIKNACMTARSLAASRGEKLQYEHLELVLNMMEDFVKDFTTERTVDQTQKAIGLGKNITNGSISQWGERIADCVWKYLKCS